MTKIEAKKMILRGLAVSLHSELHENGSEWLTTDINTGEPNSDEDQKRIDEAVDELCAEFRRRGT